MPGAARHNAASAVVDGRVWLMGGTIVGEDGYEGTATVVIYNPELDLWETGPPLPRVRAGDRFVYRGGAWEERPGGRAFDFGARESLLLG